ARRWSDADRFIGQLHVQGIDVRVGIDREGAHAEFLAGADDAQGYFAAIRDQDFFKHEPESAEPMSDEELLRSDDYGVALRLTAQVVRQVRRSPNQPQLPDTKQGLPELHRLPVFRDHFSDDSFDFGLN